MPSNAVQFVVDFLSPNVPSFTFDGAAASVRALAEDLCGKAMQNRVFQP